MADFAGNFLAGFQGAKQNMRADQQQQNANALMPLKREAMELDIAGRRQGMAIDQQRLEIARQASAREAEKFAMEVDAQELERVERETRAMNQRLIPLYEAGDPEAFNAAAAQLGAEITFDDFPVDIAADEAAFDVWNRYRKMNGVAEPDYVTLNDQLVNRAAPGGPAVVPVQGMQPGGAGGDAKDRAITRLMRDTDLDRATATGIVDGRLVISPLGEVVDKATGLPTNTPQENDPLSFKSTVPDANYSGAFGGRGFGTQIANTAADAIGSPLPAPETQTAVTALENVGLRTKTFLQSAFPGRASVQLMNELERVTAQPNRIFRGEQRSVDTLTQTSSLIEGLIEQEQRKIDNPRGYTAQMRAEAQSNIDQLGPLLADYRSILRQIDGGGQNRTSSGVTWSIEE